MNRIFTYYKSGLSQGLRPGNGMGVISVLYFTLSVLITMIAMLASAWYQVSSDHLNKTGFNRLTIEATGDAGLNVVCAEKLSKAFSTDADFRVIPQYTTMVHLADARGNFKPFLACSSVEQDPLLNEAPVLEEMKMSDGAVVDFDQGAIVSPDVLRRLGFEGLTRNSLRIRVNRMGHPDESLEFELPVVGVVGDLGEKGVRFPLATIRGLKQFQQHGQSIRSAMEEDQEIDAIHLMVPSHVSLEQSYEKLKGLMSQIRVTSPWFEQGTHRGLISTAMQMSSPILAVLLIANMIALIVLLFQKVSRDQQSLSMMRMTGAARGDIIAWYLLPMITLVAMVTAVGVGAAWIYVQQQLVPNMIPLGLVHLDFMQSCIASWSGLTLGSTVVLFLLTQLSLNRNIENGLELAR